jgi:hypothetical protein
MSPLGIAAHPISGMGASRNGATVDASAEQLEELHRMCRTGHRSVAGRPTHHDDRLTVAQPLEGDSGAVFRTNFLH